jgi:hypothetical protein
VSSVVYNKVLPFSFSTKKKKCWTETFFIWYYSSWWTNTSFMSFS